MEERMKKGHPLQSTPASIFFNLVFLTHSFVQITYVATKPKQSTLEMDKRVVQGRTARADRVPNDSVLPRLGDPVLLQPRPDQVAEDDEAARGEPVRYHHDIHRLRGLERLHLRLRPGDGGAQRAVPGNRQGRRQGRGWRELEG